MCGPQTTPLGAPALGPDRWGHGVEVAPALRPSALHPSTCLPLPSVPPPSSHSSVHPSAFCPPTHPTHAPARTNPPPSVRPSIQITHSHHPPAYSSTVQTIHAAPARLCIHPCCAQSATCHAGSRHRALWSGCSGIPHNRLEVKPWGLGVGGRGTGFCGHECVFCSQWALLGRTEHGPVPAEGWTRAI